MVKLTKLKEPKFIDELEDIILSDLDLDYIDKIQNGLIAYETISLDKISLTIDSCKISNVVFDHCDLKRVDIIDVIFENCDLSNVSFSGGSIERVKFIDCKLIGTGFDQTVLKDVLFQNCSCKYANFSFSKIKNVNFVDSNIIDGVFQEVKLDKVVFDNCNLTNGYFNKTFLGKNDFTTSDITGINVDIENIMGMKVTALQGLDLTRLLGLVVE